MDLPKNGQIVKLPELLKLVDENGKNDVSAALAEHGVPENPFVSDGCSLWPDTWGVSSIYSACFWHDVRYWCGMPGDEVSRLFADVELAKDVAVLAGPDLARTMFIGVGFGGTDKVDTPFRWGYGRLSV